MSSQILWIINEETSGKQFERLCIDLLYRNGFPTIRPTGGPQDAGRDAETDGIYWRDREQRPTFFQFSTRNDWKTKLQEDEQSIAESDPAIRHFVFVTPQNIPETTKDKLRARFSDQHDWLLTIFDREWLRFQLQEAHPDVAARHLDIDIPVSDRSYVADFDFKRPPNPDIEEAWRFFEAGDYRRAAPELEDFLRANPHSHEAFKALAWSQYRNGHYHDALQSINRAIQLADSDDAVAIRGCILAEHGIETGNVSAVREAESLFREVLDSSDSWTTPYNLGNVLSELDKYEEAVEFYKEALKQNDADSRIWKNLGSAYHHLEEHDKEFECLDRALSLDPQNPQALLSKGVSYLVDRDDPAQAVTMIELALEADSRLPTRWPHVWYWMSRALHRAEKSQEALERVEEGLRHCPGDERLIELRAKIAVEGAYKDSTLIDKAFTALRQQLDNDPADTKSIYHLAKLQQKTGDETAAWETVESNFSPKSSATLKALNVSLDDAIEAVKFLPSYHVFRHQCQLGMIEVQTEGAVSREEISLLTDFVWLVGFIVFGQAFQKLVDLVRDSDDELTGEELKEWIQQLDQLQRSGMVRVARSVGGELAPDEFDEEAIDILSANVTGLMGFTALEFTRMCMWLPVRLGKDHRKIDLLTGQYRERSGRIDFQEKLIVELLEASGYEGGDDGT